MDAAAGRTGDVVPPRDRDIPSATARGTTRILPLEPRPESAAHARRWVGDALSDWPSAALETAQLLVSELVTNAVLHARTDIELRLVGEDARLRVEVADGFPLGPLPKHYGREAETGRGLRLLASLADDWGVRRDGTGKVVWFALSATSDAVRREEAIAAQFLADLERWTSFEDPSDVDSQGTEDHRANRSGMTEICIEHLPLEVYLEAEQHNDALMREFALLVTDTDRHTGARDVPQRLLELASEVRAVFGTATTGIRTQVERALHRGLPTVDLVVTVPTNGWEKLLGLAEHLDEADRFCEEGDLLTLASSPRLRRFRRWYAMQVADQLRGLAPTAWEDDRS